MRHRSGSLCPCGLRAAPCARQDLEEAPPSGQFPFTRGPYASMYTSKPWTIRQVGATVVMAVTVAVRLLRVLSCRVFTPPECSGAPQPRARPPASIGLFLAPVAGCCRQRFVWNLHVFAVRFATQHRPDRLSCGARVLLGPARCLGAHCAVCWVQHRRRVERLLPQESGCRATGVCDAFCFSTRQQRAMVLDACAPSPPSTVTFAAGSSQSVSRRRAPLPSLPRHGMVLMRAEGFERGF